jgi:hypothetical protein
MSQKKDLPLIIGNLDGYNKAKGLLVNFLMRTS